LEKDASTPYLSFHAHADKNDDTSYAWKKSFTHLAMFLRWVLVDLGSFAEEQLGI